MGLSASVGASSALSTFSSAYAQSEALRAKSEFDSIQSEGQRRLSELMAEDTLKRGYFEANQERKAARVALSEQRAAVAASGVQVDYGTAADITRETSLQGFLNADTIESNAWRQAWGYKVQGTTIKSQAEFNALASKREAQNTLVTGAFRGFNSGSSSAFQVASYRNPNLFKKD